MVVAWDAARELWVVDRCLDAGGSFNYVDDVCDMNTTHSYEAPPQHSRWLVLVGFVLAVIGIWVAFWRSTPSRAECILRIRAIQPSSEMSARSDKEQPTERDVISQSETSQFETGNMASGGLALVLEPVAQWEQFPDLAKKWVAILNAEAASTPIISENECLLAVRIDGADFWITYDDWQECIQLEPQEKEFNHIVLALQKRLRNAL